MRRHYYHHHVVSEVEFREVEKFNNKWVEPDFEISLNAKPVVSLYPVFIYCVCECAFVCYSKGLKEHIRGSKVQDIVFSKTEV